MEAAWERGRAIYVPGIPFEASDKEIVALFNKVGPVEAFRRPAPGYGFLLFRNKADAAAAVEQRDFPCRGRVMDVQMAQKIKRDSTGSPGGGSVATNVGGGSGDRLPVTVFKGVPKECSDEQLIEALEQQHGQLDHYARNTGMVFVDFASADATASALRDGLTLEGDVVLQAVPGTSVTRIKFAPSRGRKKQPLRSPRSRRGHEQDFYLQNINHDAPTDKLEDFLTERVGPVAELRRLKPKDPFAFVLFKNHEQAVQRLADPELDLFFYGRVMTMRLAVPDKPEKADATVSLEKSEARCAALIKAEVKSGITNVVELEEAVFAVKKHGQMVETVRRAYGSFVDFVATRPEFEIAQGHVRLAASSRKDKPRKESLVAAASRSSPIAHVAEHAKLPAKASSLPAREAPSPAPMVYCAKCQTANLPNFIYCCMCGVKRGPPSCASCHAENLPAFRFCSACGRPNTL